MPIRTFANQSTADIFKGLNTKDARRVPQRVWTAAERKLVMLDGATSIADLAALPGNRVEPLKHTAPGFYTIRVNDQYRIKFRFVAGEAHDVEITEYHDGRR